MSKIHLRRVRHCLAVVGDGEATVSCSSANLDLAMRAAGSRGCWEIQSVSASPGQL